MGLPLEFYAWRSGINWRASRHNFVTIGAMTPPEFSDG